MNEKEKNKLLKDSMIIRTSEMMKIVSNSVNNRVVKLYGRSVKINVSNNFIIAGILKTLQMRAYLD